MRQNLRSTFPPERMCGLTVLAPMMVCGLLVFLSGCHLPQLCCAEKGRNLPPDFNGSTDVQNSANFGIDEFFGDPILTQLICEGLASNQELKIRNQEIQIANYEIMARRGAYLPFISIGADGGFERTSKFTPLGAAEEQLTFPGGGEFPDPLPNVRLSADLIWRVDIWRELRNARDAAMQRYCEAVEVRDFFVTQLVAEIADNYYELAALDKRLIFLEQTIEIQQQSLEVAEAQKRAARGTELGVQRFLAEVRKNESERLIVRQNIIQVENRINFLVGRYPQGVNRIAWDDVSLDSRPLFVGVPAQLLLNRRDIRAAEREVAASGLDVLVARARFFPSLDITAGVGFEAFNPRYLFDPGAFIARTAGELAAPLINRAAIKADYLSANARQLQALYDYQRTVLNAFIEVVNSISKAENYRRSLEVKQVQVTALEESITVARALFNAPIVEEYARVEYVDVLLATRDLLDARTDLLETRQQQLAAIVAAYQALGGGYLLSTSGKTFAELYCPPMDIQPVDVPYSPSDLMIPGDPMDESFQQPPAGSAPPVEPDPTTPEKSTESEIPPPPQAIEPAPPMNTVTPASGIVYEDSLPNEYDSWQLEIPPLGNPFQNTADGF